ncbi:SLC13 family permease [Ignatzschineria larvae]|uniref:SLC13 family permease n=1 Tax=Ignatzschineria larvae TaxID=112009 RepID=UPI0004279BD0|nr:SLC13 family permease [Ignatzschineria larvae]
MLTLFSGPLIQGISNVQLYALLILLCSFIAFMIGKWRYDVVALGALLVMVLVGVVPINNAFSGFSHRAVITVASVLVLSYALGNTGVTYHLSQHLSRFSDRPALLVLTLTGLVAFFSAFMNDVGALALIMPVALQVSQRYKIPTSKLLMPMAFASLLGGTATLIGTPPNMIIAQYRETADPVAGAFSMFDFLPTGIVVVIVGLIYISFIGWRLIPVRGTENSSRLFETDDYLLEARIVPNNKFIGKTIRELEKVTEDHVNVVTLLRGARRILSPSKEEILREKDVLLIEGQPEDLKQLELLTGVDIEFSKASKEHTPDSIEVLEVIVNPGARITNGTISELYLKEKYNINILGISRQGEKIRQRFSRVTLKAGDILLIQGYKKELPEMMSYLGCLPLAERNIRLKPSSKMWPTVIIFLLAILAVALQILPPHIAFPLAIFLMIIFKIITLREVYQSIDGPLVVLLGCFITVGAALEATGATNIIVALIIPLLEGLPGVVVLAIVMLITMLITDVINSSATAVIMAPIAVGIANMMGHNIDPYLMIIAIACSCAFNTPIGHHSNTLVMGPGGYQFGDYWRMGLLLDLLLIITVVPTVIFVWPL